MPDPNDDNAFPVLTDVLVPGKTEQEQPEEKKIPAESSDAAADDASIPLLSDVLTPGAAEHAQGEAPKPERPAVEFGAQAPAAASAPAQAAMADEDSIPVLTDVVAPGLAEWAADVAALEAAPGGYVAAANESAPSVSAEPAKPAAATEAKTPAAKSEAGASHGVAEASAESHAVQASAGTKDEKAPSDEPPAHHSARRSSHHAKSQAQHEETPDEHGDTDAHRAKSRAEYAAADEHHEDVPAHHRAKPHRAAAHSKAHHTADGQAQDAAATAMDADVIVERLRGRFASYLMGEGRNVIEARCRDALQDHTNWLVNQITREVALALEVEVAGWIREAVREALARHADNA
ncbi:DUF2486 family protein [Trinickia mobilis]|uniref:DUF2486 family protein n=1 Tax=Trinickia mobilis TaxID=2816356 RepID=UPI002867BE59|nr:DUF2486 family protein [Trinickia mobilis]